MIEILDDVRAKLVAGIYKNEEHIRVAVVTRILKELGWDVWNPAEVFSEYVVVPKEDSTRVDIALFVMSAYPAVFIEVKAHQLLMGKLAQVETQVRDYNRNNTATFSILTDGQYWRFYLSQTGGEFAQKCFQDFDLLANDLDDAAAILRAFLSKGVHQDGTAAFSANELLKLTYRQKQILSLREEAKKLTEIPPFPSLPEAVKQLARDKGILSSIEEITDILVGKTPKVQNTEPTNPPLTQSNTSAAATIDKSKEPSFLPLNPHQPLDLGHTKTTSAAFNGVNVKNWNQLAQQAIRFAYQQDPSLKVARRFANVSDVKRSDSGYKPVEGIPLWSQFMDSNKCWQTTIGIAMYFGVPVRVEFFWRDKENVANGGKSGLLEWKPS